MNNHKNFTQNDKTGKVHAHLNNIFNHNPLNKCTNDFNENLSGIREYSFYSNKKSVTDIKAFSTINLEGEDLASMKNNKRILFNPTNKKLQAKKPHKQRSSKEEINNPNQKSKSPLQPFIYDLKGNESNPVKLDTENEIKENSQILVKKIGSPELKKLASKTSKNFFNGKMMSPIKVKIKKDTIESLSKSPNFDRTTLSLTKTISTPEISILPKKFYSESWMRTSEKHLFPNRISDLLTKTISINNRENSNINTMNNNSSNLVDPAEIDTIYNKVFDKKFKYMINPKKLERKINQQQLENQKNTIEHSLKSGKHFNSINYVDDKLKDIKTKIFFIKGIFDYSYPKIIIQKFKVLNKFLIKQKLLKETEYMKIQNKTKELNSITISNNTSRVNLLNQSIAVNNLSKTQMAEIRMNAERNLSKKSSFFLRSSSVNKLKSKMSKTKRKSKSSLVQVYEPLTINSFVY